MLLTIKISVFINLMKNYLQALEKQEAFMKDFLFNAELSESLEFIHNELPQRLWVKTTRSRLRASETL